MARIFFIVFVVFANTACLTTIALGRVDAPVDFVRDVRPILSQHCFACHGPDENARKAGLSFLDFESATREIEPGVWAIVPGDKDRSELWARVNDATDPMPPRKEHDRLTAEEIDVLGRWIDKGASYAPHWAYVPPIRRGGELSIDAMIGARLAEEGLATSEPAERVTLFRRINLDLNGLPPTIEALDSFLLNESDDAYSQAIDTLLASPHFGERMAVFWLDLVRYADTVGYHGDQDHRAWPYRDWVINAFNANTPFDRFTIEQLAGDLLEKPTQEQLIATGYNRLLQTTHEGGAQLKEYRAIYMADRVRNVSSVWMGATVGCAQCHDHKYDPYSTRDFHALGAFFADIDDEEHLRNQYGGLNTLPTRRLPEMHIHSDDAMNTLSAIDAHLAESKQNRIAIIEALQEERENWEAELRERIAAGEPRRTVWIDDTLDTGGETSGNWSFLVEENISPHSGTVYRKQSNPGLIQHYTHKTTNKTITVQDGDMLYAWVYFDPNNPPSAVMLQCNTNGDWNHRAVWGGDQINYGRTPQDLSSYRRMGSLPETGKWTRLEVPMAKLGFSPDTLVNGIAFTQFGGTVFWDDCGVENSSPVAAEIAAELQVPNSERSAEAVSALRILQHEESEALRTHAAREENIRYERKKIEDALPKAMFTKAMATPRTVRILPRGNWLDESGEIVEPAIPAFLGSLTTDGRASRLDLSTWLVTPTSEGGVGEMTARVLVNRIWAMLMGAGLCPSLEDFGGQGRPPTHLELLDQLTLDFMISGWDVKALIKRIVMTETYKRSSTTRDDAATNDPENLLFARQARYRLSAEGVRDTTLLLSGLLLDTLGGPSVKPPQPPLYYRHLNFPKRTYTPDMNTNQWRRGVYVHWQRQFLHPMLLAFDAPTREECTARRNTSNTPTAALVLLNDPVFVEAARAFAAQVIDRKFGNDRDAIAFAMRTATSRRPAAEEIDILERLLKTSRIAFSEKEGEAEAHLAIGSSARANSADPIELASWSQVTRAILNLHETINRE